MFMIDMTRFIILQIYYIMKERDAWIALVVRATFCFYVIKQMINNLSYSDTMSKILPIFLQDERKLLLVIRSFEK